MDVQEIDGLWRKVLAITLAVATISIGTNIYQTAIRKEQDKRNERQWAWELALKKSDRIERLYRAQCESLSNIPYVAMESKESNRLEKMYRLQLMQDNTSS